MPLRVVATMILALSTVALFVACASTPAPTASTPTGAPSATPGDDDDDDGPATRKGGQAPVQNHHCKLPDGTMDMAKTRKECRAAKGTWAKDKDPTKDAAKDGGT